LGERGSRWLLAQVPGLAVEGFAGTLYGQWSAERLQWTDGATALSVEQPGATLRLGCLLQRRLCLDELRAAEVALDLPPASDEAGAPLQLPDIRLPLEIRIGHLALGSLRIDGTQQLRELSLSAQLERSGLRLSALELAR